MAIDFVRGRCLNFICAGAGDFYKRISLLQDADPVPVLRGEGVCAETPRRLHSGPAVCAEEEEEGSIFKGPACCLIFS